MTFRSCCHSFQSRLKIGVDPAANEPSPASPPGWVSLAVAWAALLFVLFYFRSVAPCLCVVLATIRGLNLRVPPGSVFHLRQLSLPPYSDGAQKVIFSLILMAHVAADEVEPLEYKAFQLKT